ncbi:MAG: hypothetical protein ACE5G8_14240, partial [Anaerolineae bacterium]
FLERAFSLLPGLSVFQAAPDALPARESFDLMIFDRAAPDTLPQNARSFLFVAPPRSTPLFTVQGTFTNTRLIAPPESGHPLVQFVDFSTLHVAEAQQVQPPPWMETLLAGQGGPLLLAGQSDGRRVAVIPFNLLRSDLPLQVDFPILTSNLSRWLLDQPPLPTAEADLETASARNPLNPAESNIRPNQARIQGAAPAGGPANLPAGRQEFWQLPALMALAILVWEWWVYWRGGGA